MVIIFTPFILNSIAFVVFSYDILKQSAILVIDPQRLTPERVMIITLIATTLLISGVIVILNHKQSLTIQKPLTKNAVSKK